MTQQKVRVDVDDRENKTVAWRVYAAKSEWVPYIIVYGEQEAHSSYWIVQLRGASAKTLSIDELIKDIQAQTAHMPFRPLIPIRLSLRPRFT